MAWCQNTLVWYVANSTNPALIAKFGDKFATGQMLGGTGLSNPMKSFFGIEKLKLKGRKVDGGYIVRGALPWVSNLGPGHFFGTIFEREDDGGQVMFLADCSDPAITLAAVQAVPRHGRHRHLRRAVPRRLRARRSHSGRSGRTVREEDSRRLHFASGRHGHGLIRDCIAIMNEVDPPLGHVNRYLPQQPENFQELLAELERETMALAADPYNEDDSYWRKVVALRLRAGEASVAAAHAAMLHCGARGYLMSHRAQRRLREAYFVAIVTPATKQLRKMLADM